MEVEPRIARTREVPPDPSIARAVGRHHTFETAIADLVDNSVDAGAHNVLIRFIQQRGAVIGLRVIDDGSGMDADGLDKAMEFARKREYLATDQGHFGLGMKAASLSQADVLRVYSRRFGTVPAGRSIAAHAPTTVGDLDSDDVAAVFAGLKVDFEWASGTVVEWAEPRTFLTSRDSADRAQWIDQRISAVISHLGVVFHRMLHRQLLRLAVDVFDADYDESGVPRVIRPIDPFGYDRVPGAGPATLQWEIDGAVHRGLAHIWPASQSGRPEFRLGGKPGSLAQGFYFYRSDRLLQIGGWNTLTVERPELEYARVAIDVTEALSRHITINPEKAGLELDADLKRALLNATVGDDRATFPTFLSRAEDERRRSRTYSRRPVRLVEPGRGFGAEMHSAFESSVERVDADPVDIRWRVERSESPVTIDLERRTIWLNEEYRDLISGGAADAADAPFIKTLMMIVYSRYFEGSHLGPRERAELDAWQQLMTAALREELDRQARAIGVEQ